MALLQIERLSGGYGGADIVLDVDLAVDRGEIVTIAGTNGAGKSTLLRGVLGLLPRASGSVRLDGRDLSRLPTEARVAAGLACVPQVANVFAHMTVLENLHVAAGGRIAHEDLDRVLNAFPALRDRRSQQAGSLSGGERQQLAFARALVRELPKHGVAVLMVEQRARQALAISDYGHILDQGRVVMHGRAAELLGDERMAQLYLGTAGHA